MLALMLVLVRHACLQRVHRVLFTIFSNPKNSAIFLEEFFSGLAGVNIGLKLQESRPLETTVMDLTEAKGAGATAMVGEKYDSQVRVVDVAGVSMELCGGTHVRNTAEIGGFKITAEMGIASGIRRIEAVAGPALIPYLNEVDAVASALAGVDRALLFLLRRVVFSLYTSPRKYSQKIGFF